MKASFFKETGEPSVLEYGEFSDPHSEEGEVLVRVKSCALNRIDVWQRSGKYPLALPHIPGSDISGILENGEEVVVNPALPCGSCERCQKNLDCEFVKIIGFSTQGAYAEWISVPKVNVYPKPKGLSFAEAASFPLTFLTAWHMLKTRAQVKPGEAVFIWGATGGLGVAAIQIAKQLGAHVIAGTRSMQKIEALKAVGADEVVLVQNETQFEKVDVVFETVGEATWDRSLDMLKPFGRLVLAGTTSGKEAKVDLQKLYTKQLSIVGSRMGTQKEFEEILALVEQGLLKPKVDRCFTLQDAVKAHEFFEAGEFVGKIVLEC